jgi:hypothetical protein
MVIYKGQSLLDNQPIIVVAIRQSKNEKTGNMVQTYILREDVDPITANRTGQDYSICGTCDLKGVPTNKSHGLASRRKCYVQIGQAPRQIYETYKRGRYLELKTPEEIAEIGRGRTVRIGSYGDGAAVPNWVWEALVREAKSHTAYTHNHGDPVFYMQSVESLQEAESQWLAGRRTFRVIKHEDEIVKTKEILCPSARVTCSECQLCGGSSVKAKSIAIVAHGATKNLFNETWT